MARTLIGELILRLKDEMSGKAKSAAGNVSSSIDDIQRAAKRLNNAKWLHRQTRLLNPQFVNLIRTLAGRQHHEHHSPR